MKPIRNLAFVVNAVKEGAPARWPGPKSVSMQGIYLPSFIFFSLASF